MLDFLKRLKTAFKWFWRGYNTNEWDDSYLLDIIRFKLEDMRDFWKNPDNIHISEKSRLRNLKNISICAFLLKRLTTDEYYDKISMKHAKKWGELNIVRQGIDKSGLYTLTEFKYTKAHTSKDNEKAKKESKRLHGKADKIKQHDKDLFFKIFSKQYESWWD
jgi:hypothetical protein